MSCIRDKQLRALESARESGAQTLAPFAGGSLWRTARNSSEKRKICDANPESSSSWEASSEELGVVTGWDMTSTERAEGRLGGSSVRELMD